MDEVELASIRKTESHDGNVLFSTRLIPRTRKAKELAEKKDIRPELLW